MREIQEFANRFCAAFGLAPTAIEFTTISRKIMNIYNFLLTPKSVWTGIEQRWDAKLANLAEQGRHRAMKDYLESEIGQGTSLKSFVSEIEFRDVAKLRAAIEICERGTTNVKLDKEAAEEAQEIAERIRRFHAQGKAISLFKEMLMLMRNERGKMPLVEAKLSDLVHYEHEAIHYILRRNGLWVMGVQPFNEGLCSFLHTRFRGKLATFGMYYPPAGRSDYRHWAKFFFDKFAKIPNGQIGPLLRRNLKTYLTEFRHLYPAL